MSSSLDSLMGNANKQFGTGTIATGGMMKRDPPRVPFGVFAVDYSVGGGSPLWGTSCLWSGESGGKTSLAINAVSMVAKICWRCFENLARCTCSESPIRMKTFWADVEGTLDVDWCSDIGASPESYYYALADYGEMYANLADSALQSDDCGLVVIDSLAALVPIAEFDAAAEDQFMGLQARMIGRCVRKLKQRLIRERKNDHPCTIIFTNQMRSKIGVMFGCLHGSTKINFVDGRSFCISTIVNNRINGAIWSYNEATCEFEPKEIIDWHHNGFVETPDDYIHVTTNCPDTKNGIASVTLTRAHESLTSIGWKPTEQLKLGDEIKTKYKSILNGTLRNFMYGCCCGDITLKKLWNNSGGFSLQDSVNPQYVQWKLSKLYPFFSFKSSRSNNRIRFDSSYSYELRKLADKFENRNPVCMLNNFEPLSFAIWIMDDGHYDPNHNRYSISIKRFKNSDVLTIISHRLEELGMPNSVNYLDGNLLFRVQATSLIVNLISAYVPPCMRYKLPNGEGYVYEDFNLESTVKYKETYAKIIGLRQASKKQMRYKGKYDISVADNHNYLAGSISNGIVVHNSPETMSGGHAMKHEFSLLLRQVQKAANESDKKKYTKHKEVQAIRHSFAVRKHKVLTLARTGEFVRLKEPFPELGLGKGAIDDYSTVLNFARNFGLVEKTKGGYQFLDQTVKRLVDIVDIWKEDHDLYMMIQKDIIAAAKIRLMDG